MPKKIKDPKEDEELEDDVEDEELDDEDDSSEDDDSTDDEDDDSDENDDNDPLMNLSKSELIYRVQKGERDTAKANRQAAKRRIELRDLKATKKPDDDEEDDTPNEEMDSLKAENQKLQTKILKLDASTKIGKTEITVEGKKYQIIDSEDILIESEDDLEDVDGLLQDAYRLKPHFFALVDPEKEDKEKSKGSPKGKLKRKKDNKKPLKFKRHHL
ncbi:MAG: hypothetical protein JRE40_00090 [Deltaproteobacteria bacterium]|nr:hypothetical protein [Deltaproteobacteria bacterium]